MAVNYEFTLHSTIYSCQD